jgi:KUP system potassium uptake protein
MTMPFERFLASLDALLVTRIPGCAIVITRAKQHTSPILLQQVRHNKILHEHVILMSIRPVGRPLVHARDRLEITDLGHGFHRVVVNLGFLQAPDLPTYVKGCVRMGLECAKGDVHYLLAYEHVERRPHKSHFPVILWHIFDIMSKNAVRLSDFLKVPDDHVFEIGIKVQI